VKYLAERTKLCNKIALLDNWMFLLKCILNSLPVRVTEKKITNLKEVVASYHQKKDIVLRLTNAQLISRFYVCL
jgi:hypothetical protein